MTEAFGGTLFFVSFFIPSVLTAIINKKKTEKVYFIDAKKAVTYTSAQNVNWTAHSYGTVIYVPDENIVDFGTETWPPKFFKKINSPRIFLLSTWTHVLLALPGGKVEKGETHLQAINREFKEETGSDASFQDSDFLFSCLEDNKKLSHFFVQVIRDEEEFNRYLSAFPRDNTREGYVDEIFGCVGFPLWVEGPDNVKLASFWGHGIAVWGLPRFLCFASFRERDALLVMLLRSKIIDLNLMKRVFGLCNALEASLNSDSLAKILIGFLYNLVTDRHVDPLPTFEVFAETPGLLELLDQQAC